jgi:hypothetical protein
MAMAYGIIMNAREPVRAGTVIKLTKEELSADPKDQSNTKIKAMYDSYRPAPIFHNEVAPAHSLKTQILLMSLFPNVENSKKTYKKTETGTYRSGMAGV